MDCKILSSLLFSIIIIAFAAAGEGLGTAPGTPAALEDLRIIREWKQTQTLQRLARELVLTPHQVETLEKIKADVDAIRQQTEEENAPIKTRIHELASRIRQDIEAGRGMDSDAEKELRSQHQDLTRSREKARLQIRLAAMDLKDLLTPAQMSVLKSHASQLQPHRKGKDGPHRPRVRGKKEVLARVLLSDAFLETYRSP